MHFDDVRVVGYDVFVREVDRFIVVDVVDGFGIDVGF